MNPDSNSASSSDPLYLRPGQLGTLYVRNRLIRAATSESMAHDDGSVSKELVQLYVDLSRGGAGLLITGHMYVETRGQYTFKQVGIHDDRNLPGLQRLAETAHEHDGKIFAEISHAGSQSTIPTVTPVAPSVIPNAIFSRVPQMMSADDIHLAIDAFGQAARRAKSSGFDGIHIHSGNGYLLSEFNSPHANLRDDEWGGDAERRGRFLVSVYQIIRDEVGTEFPVTARIGMTDAVDGGLELDESLDRVETLFELGLDGVEVSYGVMQSYLQNIRPYVGVTPRRALADGLIHRVFSHNEPEAYYRHFAKAIKKKMDIPVILVGGIRTTDTMSDLLLSGDTDFIAMARPFIREPDLPRKLAAGRTGIVDCVSCNICLMHEGKDGLRCWRKTWGRLLYHAYCRFWRDRK